MARFDVTAIGEGKLRYSVPPGVRLEDAASFDVSITGTEGNVLALLSRLGHGTGWVSQLPDSPLGRRVARDFRTAQVDISKVKWLQSETARLGLYYVEYAAPPRSTQVYYDRKLSCFTEITADDIDWDYLLDTRLLHLSGITVPLSESVNATLLEAVARAKAAGVPISFDVNYRTRLWSTGNAAEGMRPFLDSAEIIFMPARDAEALYGLTGTPEELLEQLGDMFSARYIIISLGADGIIGWNRNEGVISAEIARNTVILDRIGAGDASVAGVLHGWLQGNFAKGIRYAALTAAMALSQYGDHLITSQTELDELLDQSGGGITR